MPGLPPFSSLTLVLTEQCNLRCAYCYVPKTGRVMAESVALRAADFLLDRAPVGRDLTLSFFGGEPFLARPVMERVMTHARGRAGARLRFTVPTNGTLLDDQALQLVRASGMQMALSLDGAAATADRPDAAGVGSLGRLRPLLPRVSEFKPILRMTVTPDNVTHLRDNVITLYGWGFQRIMHQPALEQEWPAEAVETWCAEHRRLADWLCDRYADRQPMPDLITLEGIAKRLGGQRQAYCGAGLSQAAVSIEGRLFGCYRSVYDPRAERLVLGDLCGGPFNEALIATYARLHPSRALPERGSCTSCEARGGCTCYCPALGHALLGDLRGVSERACRLMRPQVAVVAEAMERMAAADRRARRRSVASHVAAAALALSLASGSAACDSRPTGPVPDAAVETVPGLCAPGMCPYQPDGKIAGLCPVEIDHGTQRDLAPMPDQPGPGLCPVKVDRAVAKDDVWGPGVCAPGLCPVKVDQQPSQRDQGGPAGLCPPPPPGLCPWIPPDLGRKP